MMKDYQEKIIALLIRQESMLAILYAKFAGLFPEQKSFWQKLAEEERKHGEWLETLYEAAKRSVLLFDEGKVKTYTLNTFIEGVEATIAKVDAGQVNEQQALRVTLDLERALIEKNVFAHFEGVSDKAIGVLKQLRGQTENHIQQVEEMCRE